MVDELLVAPEVQGVGLGRGDVEAEEVDPEGARPLEVGHHEVDVGHPDDVGRRRAHHSHAPTSTTLTGNPSGPG